MEPNGVASYRHRRSPSSDRFLGVFSPPSSSGVISGGSSVAGDDFSEDDVFWTGDFAEQKRQTGDPVKVSNWNPSGSANNHQSFRHQDKFGILAALPEDNGRKPSNRPVLNRRNPTVSSPTTTTPASSSSRLIPSIPRPNKQQERDFSQSMPLKFQQSAPVNVPIFARKPRTGGELADVEIGEDDEEEMLPPHEIVARGSSNSPHTTFSVLEGAGRTLKGRDLRLVRNAVWRKTVPPDSSLAPEWYHIEDKKGEKKKGELMLVVWLVTEADEAFPDALYVRVNVVEVKDLARTGNALWNEDMMFVATEPFEDHLILTIEDRMGPNEDEALGRVFIPMNAVGRRADDRFVHSRWFNLHNPSDHDVDKK
ncbi:hypothetical protein OSB04_023408 [Centaurea solstitialis]|uniref:C2 domain-containing protein n=1 Tax=Centaurea solstitialis TaxID=347529 RepID=A0AA38SVX2_9ASTR|nr:hypothetical protein OSB04_023408 [Centaurea solstitialis]